MAFTLSLSEARTEIVHLAALDGKNGANGRHSPARLDAIINRTYRLLQSRAYSLGLPHGLANTTGTLAVALAGEDFISLDIPAAASEVVGVDVRLSQWEKLDPLSWEQRRDVTLARDGRVLCDGVLPSHGVGFWAVRLGPSVATTVLTQGALAIFPTGLSGRSYTIHFCRQVGTASGTDVLLMHDGWDEWLLAKAAMACCARDTNKRSNYDSCNEAWGAADALLVQQARRLGRAGVIAPTPYQGRNP